MKNDFDLAPVIKAGSGKFIARVAFFSLIFVVAAAVAGQGSMAVGLFRGIVLGVLDLIILFAGMKKSLAYADAPEKGVKIVRRHRYYSLIIIASVIVLMLRMKFPVFDVFLGLLLIHIFFIGNLLFVSYRLNNERNVKKGE